MATPNSTETSAAPRISPAFLRSMAAMVAVGAFFAFIDPFGATEDLPLWASFIYWTALIAIGWFGGPLLSEGLRIIAPTLPSWLNYSMAVAIAALAVAVSIVVVQALLNDPVPQWYWPRLYGLVLGISVGVAAVASLVERAYAGPSGVVTHAPAAGGAPVSVRFLERFPAKIKGGVLYAVSAEDHYLRLHTSKGADLILMRLTDAITELEGLEGAQTHRSWWVAKDAVENTKRDGDKLTLVLKGGVEAPVSRPNVRPLREAGWF